MTMSEYSPSSNASSLIDPKGAILPYEIFLMVVEAVIKNAVAQLSMNPGILHAPTDFSDGHFLHDDHTATRLIISSSTDLFHRFDLIRDIRQVNRQARSLVEKTFFKLTAAWDGERIGGCLPAVAIWTCPQVDAFACPFISQVPEYDRIRGLIENITARAETLDVKAIADRVPSMPKLRFLFLTFSSMTFRRPDDPHDHAEDLPLDPEQWPDLDHVAAQLKSAETQVLWDRNIRVVFAQNNCGRLEPIFELVRSSDVDPQAGQDDWGLRMRFLDIECHCRWPASFERYRETCCSDINDNIDDNIEDDDDVWDEVI